MKTSMSVSRLHLHQRCQPALSSVTSSTARQVATNSRVYLFDIFLLGSRAFNNGLQMILEDKRILKVADVLQFSMETGGFLPNCISTLQESLIRHLKVAPRYLFFLEERQKRIQENPEIWLTRPLPPSLLKILALETTYLLPLRLVLLDEVMSDLTTLVDGYLNTYREGSADRLAGTEPACMELPAELLQLQDFQKQRRERAVKEYRVNARGLLIRTPLHPKEPTACTAGKEERVQGFLFYKTDGGDQVPRFLCPKSHEDEKFLDKESKQTTAKSQIVPPRKEGEAHKDSKNKPGCWESAGPEDPRAQKAHALPPTWASQSQFSLKEEIEQLTVVGNKGALTSPKEGALVSPSLLQETWEAPTDTFHLPEKAEVSTLPPCPALEKTDSWISPSLNLF